MLNTCGYAVPSSSISWHILEQLYAALTTYTKQPEYKCSALPQPYAPPSPQLSPSQISQTTAVSESLIPTIHNTNKNYKKFYTNNLLLIYLGGVHK